jgi:hypothetical protein
MKCSIARRSALCLATALALVTSCPMVGAQTGQGLRANSSILTPDYLAVRNFNPPTQPPLPELGSSSASTRFSYGSVVDLNSYVQIEMPRDLGDGRYSRPKVRLGMQSESLKSLMNSAGLQPDRCTLPSLRARSSASSDEASASVMLFARCSFY